MNRNRLTRDARLVLVLNALYVAADALCSIFVGVYLWINSLELHVVCLHYLALYAVTPVVFILAGWYSQARDRLHVYRLGLFLHAVYYGTILYLREDAARLAPLLGGLLGVTWGLFWAGNNVFNYDVSGKGRREYYFGWLSAVSGAAQLFAPMLAGFFIEFMPNGRAGYHTLFALAALLYLTAMALSLRMPPDKTPRPYHIRRALFPGKDQRDWRMVMLAAFTLAGAFSLFNVLLGIVMFIETGKEANVGLFASAQAMVGILIAYTVGRMVTPRTRRRAMLFSTCCLLAAGTIILWRFNIYTVIAFGFLRSLAGPLFEIPHSSVRFDVIEQSAPAPGQHIEYIAAWEAPLAVGRVLMVGFLIALYLLAGMVAVRIVLFALCVNRFFTFLLLSRTSAMRHTAGRR